MYQAINERNDERTEMFWTREELEQHLSEVSKDEDFWDVMKDGHLECYWVKVEPDWAGMGSYEQFVAEHIDIPDEMKEPFCPFCGCYCDVAYNIEHCRNCEECMNAYEGKPSTFECVWGDGEPESVVATLDPPPEEEENNWWEEGNWWGYDARLTGEDLMVEDIPF